MESWYTKLEKRHLTDVNNYQRLTNDLHMTETKSTNGLVTDRLNNTRTKNRPIWLTIDGSKPIKMTDDKLNTSLSASTILAKLTNHVQRTRFITPSTDDVRSGCWIISHQQQFFFRNYPHPDDNNMRTTKSWKCYISFLINVSLRKFKSIRAAKICSRKSQKVANPQKKTRKNFKVHSKYIKTKANRSLRIGSV